VFPWLSQSSVPSLALKVDERRKHVYENVKKACDEYRGVAGALKSDYADDLLAIKDWRLRDVRGWFYIYDALGSTGVNIQDEEMSRFYTFAESHWLYEC